MEELFAEELMSLERTYEWASRRDVERLARALGRADGPLLAVGSGGSLTAAEYAAFLHERVRGHLARSATPLDAQSASAHVRGAHVLLLSAGGRNHDVLDALAAFVRREPRSITVLCGSVGTPLGRAASGAFATELEEFELETGREGFLATNSLLTFMVLLLRAYARASGAPLTLPRTLAELVGADSLAALGEAIHASATPLWARETLVVLHGPTTRAAAVDVESKFSEAVLGAVQLTDYRNFAHGRQLWLARRGASTAVVALTTPSDEALAKCTLALLPEGVPVLPLPLSVDPLVANIAGLVVGYHVAASAGRARGVDPGRPDIPEFARRLYEMRAPLGRRGAAREPGARAARKSRR